MNVARKVVEAILKEVDLPDNMVRKVYDFMQHEAERRFAFDEFKNSVWDEWFSGRDKVKYKNESQYDYEMKGLDSRKDSQLAIIPKGDDMLIPYTLYFLSIFLNIPPLKPKGDVSVCLGELLPDNRPLPYTVPLDITLILNKMDVGHFGMNFVKIDLPHRNEHTHILGATGSGKTVLLKNLVFKDSKKDASLVVMAPKGDLIPFLLKSPVPEERILLISPKNDLKLNLFDVSHANSTVTVSLLNYVINSLLDADTTAKQTGLLNYCIRLCLNIPGATIRTLRDILKSRHLPEKYEQYVKTLSQAGQDFFADSFHNTEYGKTKSEVMWRINTLLENEFVERIFCQPETNIRFNDEIENKKVILIDTAIEHLGESGSAFFGRFFIALLNLASQRRQSNLPVYAYIDEAAQYIDHSIESMLELAREANVGITLAHQQLSQLGDLAPTVMTNTSTKIIGRCSQDDARKMGKEMYVEPDALAKQDTFHFHLWTRKLGAMRMGMPPKYIDSLPKRDTEQFYNRFTEPEPVDVPTETPVKDDDLDFFNEN